LRQRELTERRKGHPALGIILPERRMVPGATVLCPLRGLKTKTAPPFAKDGRQGGAPWGRRARRGFVRRQETTPRQPNSGAGRGAPGHPAFSRFTFEI
jgi:hypothetical protein